MQKDVSLSVYVGAHTHAQACFCHEKDRNVEKAHSLPQTKLPPKPLLNSQFYQLSTKEVTMLNKTNYGLHPQPDEVNLKTLISLSRQQIEF